MRSSAWIANAIAPLAAVAAVISSDVAQTWPDRPVKTALPHAPGGATDAIGRPWAERDPEELRRHRVEDIETNFMVIEASSIEVA